MCLRDEREFIPLLVIVADNAFEVMHVMQSIQTYFCERCTEYFAKYMHVVIPINQEQRTNY